MEKTKQQKRKKTNCKIYPSRLKNLTSIVTKNQRVQMI